MRHLKESKQDELNFKNWLNNDKYADLFIKFRQGFKQPENDYYYWIKKKQPEDLVKFINAYQDQKQTKEKKHQEVMNGAEFLGEENGYKVYYITTWEASKTLGQGAKWCISMKNESTYWKDYTSKDIKFYFFISSQTKYALALYPKVLEVNNFIDNNTYLIKSNFEIYNAEDKLDYSIINELPVNLIPEQIVLEKENAENGLFIKDNKLIKCNKELKEVNIPSGIISIEDFVFYNCRNLTSITIPNSVTSIGDNAFSCCSSLTSIELPDGLTSIGEYAFYNCSSLTSIELPNSVTSIGVSAFYNCYRLTSIRLPDSVTSIGVYTFYNCSSLTSIVLPSNIIYIGDGAFSDCSSLTSVIIPDSVTYIGDYTFYNCTNLKDVYYLGSHSDWEKIKIYTNNNNLLEANIHFNSKNEELIETLTLNEMKGKSFITEEKILTYINDCIKDLKSLGYIIDNDIDFMWGDTTKTFGTMFWPNNEGSNYILVLNKHMINEPEEAIKTTIYHELAHYINNKNLLLKGIAYWLTETSLRWDSKLYKQGTHGAHGQWWQNIVNNINSKLGTKISRTSNYQLHTGVGDYAKTQDKYIVTCKNCGSILTFKRKTDFVKNPNESTYDFYVRKYGQAWADYIWPDEKTKQLKKNTPYWSCGRCHKSDWEVEENS